MRALVLCAILLCAAGTAAAQNTTAATPPPEAWMVTTPALTRWVDAPPSLPPGARVALLDGDPSQPGPFTMRIMLPDGYTIAPHTHPGAERVTVISGTFMIGVGEAFDASRLVEIPAGSYSSLAPGIAHYARAKGTTVVQLNNIGPWTLHYVNPADDPRSATRN